MSKNEEHAHNVTILIGNHDIAWRISAKRNRKGTVKDKAGETVIGASVVQKGNTGNGTITDIDGNYSLNVPSNSTLIFSYVGMTTQEIAVKGQKLSM